jgi:hypothetical protein
MPSSRQYRRQYHGRFLGVAAALLLLAASGLSAEGARISLDAASLGLGAAFSAANARVCVQLPLEGPWGAGPGLGGYDARALGPAGGPASSEQVGVKLYLAGETGWTIPFGGFPLFFEPFVRVYGAAGWDGRSGSAVTPLSAWSAFAGVDAGLRAGWKL